MLQLPIYWCFMFVDKDFIGFGEVPAAEKGSPGQGAGVGRFEHMVARGIYKRPLAPGEIPPKKEYYSFAII